jgi:hypothetical protein
MSGLDKIRQGSPRYCGKRSGEAAGSPLYWTAGSVADPEVLRQVGWPKPRR